MTGIEPAISGLTGRRDNRLRYTSKLQIGNIKESLELVKLGFNIIQKLYCAENLAEPAIMPWPLDRSAEKALATREKRFLENLDAGLPSGLSWMTRHAAAKYRPDRVLPGCRSVFISFLNYFRNDEIDKLATGGHEASAAPLGRIARYARGRDYHKELGLRLKRIAGKLRDAFPEERFKHFTDIGPLDEVWLAEASGAGFRGRHGLAIFPNIGSWVVLGHILTTLPYRDGPVHPSPLSCPDGCRRCIEACPGGALEMPGRLNPARCISYQSIEHKGVIEEAYRENTKDWLFGCDVCQEVCPFNAQAKETGVEGFRRDYAGAALKLTDILAVKNKADLTQDFAGSPLMRAGRAKLVRSACTAAGNCGNSELMPALEALLDDEDAGIRDHAAWAVKKIRQRSS